MILDLSDKDSVQRAAQDIQKACPQLDALIQSDAQQRHRNRRGLDGLAPEVEPPWGPSSTSLKQPPDWEKYNRQSSPPRRKR